MERNRSRVNVAPLEGEAVGQATGCWMLDGWVPDGVGSSPGLGRITSAVFMLLRMVEGGLKTNFGYQGLPGVTRGYQNGGRSYQAGGWESSNHG